MTDSNGDLNIRVREMEMFVWRAPDDDIAISIAQDGGDAVAVSLSLDDACELRDWLMQTLVTKV